MRWWLHGSCLQSRGQLKERAFVKRLQETNADEAKNRVRIAQGLPLTTDKPEVYAVWSTGIVNHKERLILKRKKINSKLTRFT